MRSSGLSAPAGGDINEHVWYDFPTVDKVIDKVEATFTSARPAEASTFSANAVRLKGQIGLLVQKEAQLKSQYSGVGVAITEPVPLYMLNAIGLDNKTPSGFSKAIEEGNDAAPEVLQQTLSLYSTHAKLLAYNEQTTGAQTEAVLTAAKSSNIAVVPVTETLPSGKRYLSWMSDNLNAIAAALAG